MDLILQHGIERKKNTSTFNVLVRSQNLGGFFPQVNFRSWSEQFARRQGISQKADT